jgi:hypothetical protein
MINAIPLVLLPSPLVREGGEVERRENEPGEGVASYETYEENPSPALPRIKSGVGHPLPQGERGTNRAECLANM